MSMKYIRDYYKVPAKRGGRIAYRGDGSACLGTIVGSQDQYLRVRFDDEPKFIDTVHPTWEVEYMSERE